MITKLLRRFCSNEVKVLLKHLEENPEDFTGMTAVGRWEYLLDEVQRRGTFIEQTVARSVEARVRKTYRRKKMLSAILQEKLDPQSEEKEDRIDTLHQQQQQNSLYQQYAEKQLGAANSIAAAQAPRYDRLAQIPINPQTR